MKLLAIFTTIVYITSSMTDMPFLQYVAERLFTTAEGQVLLAEMNEVGIHINVDGTIYGSGSTEVTVIGYDIQTNANGEYFHSQLLIRLNENDFGIRTTRGLMGTLAHEIQHALDFARGYNCNIEERAFLRAESIWEDRNTNVESMSGVGCSN